MTVLQQELIDYIRAIPDKKLEVLKPLIMFFYQDSWGIEKVDFNELTESEKAAILKGESEYLQGETVNHQDINWN